MNYRSNRRCRVAAGAALFTGLFLVNTQAQQIKWGLTLANINNPITPIVVTNLDGSISITAGGGDTYGSPDSLTYAYQQVTGDFDVNVQIVNVTATDVFGQDTPKGSLMLRASLDPATYDVQINATPPDPSNRNGQIESIGRINLANDTDDLPGRLQMYGGDTTANDYCTYPDVWLRIQRQGQKVMTYFKTDITTDFPSGASPMSTNGWQLLAVVKTGTNFPNTCLVGLSTVSHNSDINDTTHTVTSTYNNYGPTPTPASTPSDAGVAVDATNAPGAFPNTQVLAANFDASLPADGLGYASDIAQSNQPAGQPIIWNSGGYGSVSRDIIANIRGETPGAFSFARYQAGAFDFMVNPRDPVAAAQILGPYSNPARERYTSGDITVAASQAWAPSPNYGFVFTTVHKNGESWNDTSPSFYGATYVQLDGIATGEGYDMIGGHFRGGQFYTRTTKLVTGSPTDPSSGLGNLQRAAIPVSLAWFPYDQGWKAGYFNPPNPVNGFPNWKDGDGWGMNSGTAVIGLPVLGGQNNYNNPGSLLTWVDISGGGGVYTGLAVLSLPGVSSASDGMLFTIGNDENNSTRGPSANNAALPDGSGWYVAVRDMETSKVDPTVYATGGGNDAGASFSFLYVPYNSDNLVGGHILTNGVTAKGAGNFSVTHLSKGRYAITIPGKTDADGVLLLENSGYLASQPAGFTNVVDTSVLSYEYGGTNVPANAFIVDSYYADVSGGGEGVITPRDAEFNFVYVDFLTPLAPPGTTRPVLSIKTSGANVIVSWTNGAGFVLQKSTSLGSGAVWTDVGTANPSAPIATGGGSLFFRVKSP